MVVVGTRPEAIKLSPLIVELRETTKCVVEVVYTRQHADLVTPIFEFFGVKVDVFLELRRSEDVGGLYGELLTKLSGLVVEARPSAVIVQGDTASTLSAGMAGFLNRVPVVHVEAGLRTGDMNAPWPEEFNRRAIGLIADLHFAHSEGARANLAREGTPLDRISISGNTGIDAAVIAEKRVSKDLRFWKEFLHHTPQFVDNREFLLLTVHRRENHGEPLDYICDAVDKIVDDLGYQVVIPVHPNPDVLEKVNRRFSNKPGVVLSRPLNYPMFMAVMIRSKFILTDSGGIQEEAPCLGKPVIILRNSTERQEVEVLGSGIVAGPSASAIVDAATRIATDDDLRREMSIRRYPFGSGDASRKIVSSLLLSGEAV